MIASPVVKSLKQIHSLTNQPAVAVRAGGLALLHSNFFLVELPLQDVSPQLPLFNGPVRPLVTQDFDWRIALTEKGVGESAIAAVDGENVILSSKHYKRWVYKPIYDLFLELFMRPDLQLFPDRGPDIPSFVNVYDGKELLGVIAPIIRTS